MRSRDQRQCVNRETQSKKGSQREKQGQKGKCKNKKEERDREIVRAEDYTWRGRGCLFTNDVPFPRTCLSCVSMRSLYSYQKLSFSLDLV